ncbi:MAG: hypothetical protein AAB263_07040, partial [Planctomycetota bacterium]
MDLSHTLAQAQTSDSIWRMETAAGQVVTYEADQNIWLETNWRQVPQAMFYPQDDRGSPNGKDQWQQLQQTEQALRTGTQAVDESASNSLHGKADLGLDDAPKSMHFRVGPDGVATLRWGVVKDEFISADLLQRLTWTARSHSARELRIELVNGDSVGVLEDAASSVAEALAAPEPYYDFASGEASTDQPDLLILNFPLATAKAGKGKAHRTGSANGPAQQEQLLAEKDLPILNWQPGDHELAVTALAQQVVPSLHERGKNQTQIAKALLAMRHALEARLWTMLEPSEVKSIKAANGAATPEGPTYSSLSDEGVNPSDMIRIATSFDGSHFALPSGDLTR